MYDHFFIDAGGKVSFQVVGKDEELNNLLNKMNSGMLSCCAYSLSDNIGHNGSRFNLLSTWFVCR